MKACDAWGRVGLEPAEVRFVSGAGESDPDLFEGRVDFIFGSHISPYIHKANGIPFAQLAQTVNYVEDAVVTAKPIQSLKDLEGKVVADFPYLEAGGKVGANHPRGNHELYLRYAGLDREKIQWLEERSRDHWRFVLEGKADAAFALSAAEEMRCRRAGLHVFPLPRLPMVQSTTVTTMWPTAKENPDRAIRMIKAVACGVHFIKTKRQEMRRVMETDVAPELGIRDEEVLRALEERNAEMLEASLYPTHGAIANAFELAVLVDPSLRSRMNPLSLWDLHYLRQIEEEGFFKELSL